MSYTKTNWENLPSTNTPVNASNLNKIENELDILEKSTTYSTTEQRIGTWIDGKPIYRKVITGNFNFNSSGYSSTSLNLNVETITKLEGFYKTLEVSKYVYHVLPRVTDDYIRLNFNTSQQTLNFITSTTYKETINSLPFQVILEYTKTTD